MKNTARPAQGRFNKPVTLRYGALAAHVPETALLVRLFGLKEIGQCRSRTGCSGGHGVRLRGWRRCSAALRLLAVAGIAGRGG